MSAIWRRSWPSMSAISITGARIARLDNVRPAHRRHLRRIEALKLEESLRYRCLEVSITFISGPHDVLDQILAPYSPRTVLLLALSSWWRDAAGPISASIGDCCGSSRCACSQSP